MFRIRHALVTFRFVELLTRTPTPRPLRSSSWGYGFLPDPSPRSSSDCPMPTTPGIPTPRTPDSRRVQALAVPATAPCPRPLASPILELPIPVRSEPSQFQRLRHAHAPWDHQASSCRFPWGPSSGSSSDCPMPTTPGIPNPQAVNSRQVRALAVPATAPCPQPLASPVLTLQIPVGSKPSQLQRQRHAHDPWHPQASSCQFPSGPSPRNSADCPGSRTPASPIPMLPVAAESKLISVGHACRFPSLCRSSAT